MSRPLISSLAQQPYIYTPNKRPLLNGKARIVTNTMPEIYRTYLKNAALYWSDFPTATPLITWGETLDGSQSFTANTDGVTARVWGQWQQFVTAGETYILSFTIVSKTGPTPINNNVDIFGVTGTGTTSINNPAIGRHGMRMTFTSTGTLTMRMGLGTAGAGALNASIKFANVMMERVLDARTYPSEYVNPNDARAFDYTYSATQTGTLITSEAVGPSVKVPMGCSVIVVGDSMTDNTWSSNIQQGDFPFQMRNYIGKRAGISVYGIAGDTMQGSETQLINAMADNIADSRALPWRAVILQGGTNNANASESLALLQTRQLSRIALARSYNLIPICVTIPPLGTGDATKKQIISDYSAWLTALCVAQKIPCYDVFSHANDGAGNWKTRWDSPDQIHPGTGEYEGATRWARKMSDLVALL